MDRTENRRKWQAFLQPLRISQSPVKSLPNIKIKTRVPGAQCLSQTFGDKLLENTNRPITIKGHSEDVQKAQEISQQQQDNDYCSTVFKTRKEESLKFTAVKSSSVPVGTEAKSEVRSSNPAGQDSSSSVIETWNENQWKHAKSKDTDQIHVPGQINVELFDNSKENPIAISDDDSIEEAEIVSLASRKRKQGSETNVQESSLTKQVPDDLFSTLSTLGKDEKEHDHKILDDTFSKKAKKIKGVEGTDSDIAPSTLSVSLALKKESETGNATVLTDEAASQISDNDVIEFAGEALSFDMREESCNKNLKKQSLKEELVTESHIPVSKQPSEGLSFQSTEDKTIHKDSRKIRREPTIQNEKEGSLDICSKESSHTRTAELSFPEIANLTREYSIERTRTKNEYSPSKKDDIDKPCSQWKIDLFVRYFDFEKCVENLELERYRDFSKDSDLNHMVADFKRRVKVASSTVVKHNTNRENTWEKKTEEEEKDEISEEEEEGGLSFASLCRTEMGTRLILNEILFPLCSILDFTVEIERNVDCIYLPNCRFDYRIYDADGEIVGAVEAKRGGSIRPDSVVQAVIELCILQAERLSKLRNATRRLDFPLFNILTDGMRFIFIILKGDKLYFEQSFNKIRVREMTSLTEVFHLYGSLLQLMRMRTEEEWVSSAWKLEL